MPNEKNIHFKGKGVKDFVENVAIAWRAKYPGRAAEYLKVLEHDLRAQANVSGMSKQGKLRYTGAIPTDVFHVIEKKIPGFFSSPDKLKVFQDIFMGDKRPRAAEQKYFFQGGK